ncbi:hypothetical protein WR25_27285 [Diploscapter pachys]|uniref:PDZ domain-containing protein n=1 Tax=Diploscapter pachys TaxID=2018661 RepID=A0A2A2JHH9_9BILA|nr:hypothetical protein WR25_27285 [Diploscapter pachys]
MKRGSQLFNDVVYFSPPSTSYSNQAYIPDGYLPQSRESEAFTSQAYRTVDHVATLRRHINKKTQYERPTTVTVRTQSGQWDAPTVSNRTSLYDYSNRYSNIGNGTLKSGQNSQYNSLMRNKTSGSSLHAENRKSSNVFFTRDPNELRGEMINTTIVKGPKGLGFTLIGNDDSSNGDEFIQVKSILAGGPAAADGVLRPGDVIVRVNDSLLLGATQSDACQVFLAIPVGDSVFIQVCRGYPLMLDPGNRIITENVYAAHSTILGQADLHVIEICKGADGFGFTIADSVNGQRVKKILYPVQCPNLMEGDTIVEFDSLNVRAVPHSQLVDMLIDKPIGYRGRLVVKRASPKHSRSRTPTAAFRYGEKAALPSTAGINPRSKTPAPNQRQSSQEINGYQKRNGTLQRQSTAPDSMEMPISRMRPSSTTLGFATTPNYVPYSQLNLDHKTSDLITINLIRKPHGFGFRLLGGSETKTPLTVGQIVANGAAAEDGRMREGDEIVEIDGHRVEGASHSEAVSLLDVAAHNKHVKMVVRRRKHSADTIRPMSVPVGPSHTKSGEYDVTLQRNDIDGFGFVIISSLNKNGSTIGQITPGSPADLCGELKVGDRVIAVNGIDILNLSHSEIINLIKSSGLSVRLTIAAPATGTVTPLASSTLSRMPYGQPNYKLPEYQPNGGFYSSYNNSSTYATQNGSRPAPPYNHSDGLMPPRPTHINGAMHSLNINGSISEQDEDDEMTPTAHSLQPSFSMSPQPHQVVVTRLKTMISTSSADEESLITATAPDDDGLHHLAEPEEAPELERRNSMESILSSIRHCSVLDSYSETDEFRLIDASPTSTISSSNRCNGCLISVELERGPKGFGFSIRGGQEFGAMPLFVLRIADDGPAAQDGRLKVGDELITINGESTKGMTHDKAISLIKTHPNVRLTVRRPKLP